MSLLEDGDKKEEKKKSTTAVAFSALRKLLPYYWPSGQVMLRVRLVLAMLLLVGARVVSVLTPILWKHVIDSLPASLPLGLIVVYVMLRILTRLLSDLRDQVFTPVSQHATAALLSETFEHVQLLPLQFHLTKQTGTLLKTLQRGGEAVGTVQRMILFNFFPTLVELTLVLFILIGAFGALYALIVVISIASYIAATILITNWRTKFRRAMNEASNASNQVLHESLTNFEAVKLFTSEHHEAQLYLKTLRDYFAVEMQSVSSLTLLNFTQVALINGGLFFAVWRASAEVVAGTHTLGDLVAVSMFMLQLYQPLSFLGSAYRWIIQAFIDLEQIFSLLAEHNALRDAPGAPDLVVSKGDIRFDNVSFAYKNGNDDDADERVILRNVSLHVPAGQTVAVVGRSGAGKSTLARLLCRMYDPSSGAISIDGQNIAGHSQRSLRAAIGVVPQDTPLFNNSIRYNVAYGDRERASEAAVRAAVEGASLSAWVASLGDGLETVVGERGLRVSGGEKQRIAIARVLLKNPPILISDEATSSLDSRTEAHILESLAAAAAGRTCLTIAHRLSTVRNANRIVVLDQGAFVEQGTHAELMALDGIYAAMYKQQQEEAADEDKQQQAGEASSDARGTDDDLVTL